MHNILGVLFVKGREMTWTTQGETNILHPLINNTPFKLLIKRLIEGWGGCREQIFENV